MSKQRQRDREARVVARQAEIAEAAKRRAKKERRRLAPTLPRRRERYGRLTNRELGQLVAVFVAVQVVSVVFLSGLRAHLGLAVLTLMVLAVVAASRRSTS